jgi:hypothetical protein
MPVSRDLTGPRVLTAAAFLAWVGATTAGVAGVWMRVSGQAPVIATTFGFGDAAMVTFVVLGSAWASVGALLVWRRPRNTIGRFMVLIGVGNAGSVLAAAITFQAVAQGDLELARASGWWTVLLSSLGQLSLYLGFIFPTGRGPTERWDRVAKACLGGMVLVLGWLLTRPGALHLFRDLANPLGFGPDLQPALGRAPDGVVVALSLLLAPLLVGSVVVRYRRAGHIEQLQVRWVLSALVLSFGALVLTITTLGAIAPGAPLVAYGITGTLVPVSIGVAVLRYRLYEIDRIISRTIGWALVTVTLAVVFVMLVVGLQAVLAPVTDENTLAVAASTLAAFALFQPLRRRVQRVVDRRFDRARYDGQRTVDAFARRLRDETDMGRVTNDLAGTATAAVAPTSLAIWLRPRSFSR